MEMRGKLHLNTKFLKGNTKPESIGIDRMKGSSTEWKSLIFFSGSIKGDKQTGQSFFFFSKLNRILEGLNMLEKSGNFAHASELVKTYVWYGFQK